MNDRVWDKFLTEQDKAHVALLANHRQVGFGKRPALLMVDFYRHVFGYTPQPLLEAIETWPGSCGMAAWNSIPHVQTILSAARSSKIPVIHFTSMEKSSVPGWQRFERTQPNVLNDEEKKRREKAYEIIDEVAPIPGELVLLKSSPSAFWGTPLVGHLIHLGVDTLIVCGESTSGCVRATVVDGCTWRYRVIVVEEGVFDRHEAAHALNLFDMDQKYADVLPTGKVLDYLSSLSSTEAPQASLAS